VPVTAFEGLPQEKWTRGVFGKAEYKYTRAELKSPSPPFS
jgi:hypothetical protein